MSHDFDVYTSHKNGLNSPDKYEVAPIQAVVAREAS